METIDLINGLNDAYRILIKARMESASDAACIWNKLNHAADRINRQIEELLAPPPEPVEPPIQHKHPIRYISCQSCGKPVGNQHEAATGKCYQCESNAGR